MKSLNNQKPYLYEVADDLQQALIMGWEKLKTSPSYKVYEEAFQYFLQMGLYEGLFRPYIPNPVYDNAAKELGQEFLNQSLALNISYRELFPGDFTISTEVIIDGLECRVFYLTAMMNRQPLGKLKITFSHCHDHFEFPTPPILEVVA